MKFENRRNIQLSKTMSIKSFYCWDEVSLFGETVNDYQQGVETMRRREISDEIHRD